MWRKGNPLTLLGGMQVGAATLENSVEIPQEIELPYDPAIALLGIYPKDTDVVKRRAICTPMFIAAMAIVTKLWKEPRCPSMNKWIKYGPYTLWSTMPPSERMNTQLLKQHGRDWKRFC